MSAVFARHSFIMPRKPLTPMWHVGLMDALDTTPCTHLESLGVCWWHKGGQDRLYAQDLHACERLATVLASTPQTLRRLTFTLPEMLFPALLADTLSCVAPRVEEAVEKFPGLETITVRLIQLLSAEECMDVARSRLPTRLGRLEKVSR